MLKSNIYITYGNRTLVYPSLFEAKKGQVIAIVGHSGCGKSTILKAFQLLNYFAYNYFIDDIKINNTDTLFCYLATFFQNPSFIEDLTIKEQILFLYQTEDPNINIWAEKLDVISCLDKYPNQLSGGQKIRVALLITILKKAPYLLIDEPTASLDEQNKERVMQVLQEYAKLGNCVILATHDTHVYSNANVVYSIENKNLIKQKDDLINESIHKTVCTKIKKRKYFFSRLLHRKKESQRLLTIFTIFSIFLLLFTIQFGNVLVNNHNNALSTLSSKEIIVSKSDSGIVNNFNSGIGGGVILEEEDLQFLENIVGVEEVLWRYQTHTYDITFSLEYNSEYFEEEVEPDTIISLQDSNIIHNSDDYLQSIYYDYINYDADILYKFQEEGVYLSKEYASLFTDDLLSLEGASITIDLFIPIYNSIGKVYTMVEEIPFYLEMDSVMRQEVTLEIAGILVGSQMGIDLLERNGIYISQEILQSYIIENQRDEEIVTYVKEIFEGEEFKGIITSLEYIDGYSRKVIETGPWTPCVYTVICESIDDVPLVTQVVNDAGFNAYSDWSEVSSLYDIESNNDSIVRIFTITCAMVILLVNIGIKVNNRKDEKKYSQFLFDQLYTPSEIRYIKLRKYTYFFIRRTFQSLITITCLITLLYYSTYMPIQVNRQSIFIIISILFILEVIVPVLVEGRVKNDKTN